MDIGVALPTMAADYSRDTTLAWCRGIDEGPYSSVSCGERITFRNQEVLVTNAAAAALTERARVFVNIAVAPLHPTPVLAKQLATLDVLADGRLDVGLGVGGREHDFRAAGAPFARRHQRLDDQVAELRELWAGVPPFEGADPVGPAPVQSGGPPLLAAARGPKALARAARWADGVSGFSVCGVPEEMAAAVTAAHRAWAEAGRDDRPRMVSGCFYALGSDDAASARTLERFTAEYLAIFGAGLAEAMARDARVASPAALEAVVAGAAEAGVDELILVPATTDPDCLARTTRVVTGLVGTRP
jgi:alkanesulfonate monooxygenase SsuD/methylene tetrahydromethanopterin reductase-like flavin-dependent oxidoreductase (luciferase family)